MVEESQQENQRVTALLLVDDEAPVLQATTWALKNAGFRSYSADTIDAAMAILGSQTAVSGVILDRGLAGTRLVAVLARMREIAPSVVIVGTSGSDCRVEFLDAGADHFLLKPWTTNQVIALFEAGSLSPGPDQA